MADNDIKIYGAVRAMTGDGIAAYAEQIYDEESGKYLPELLEESGGGGTAESTSYDNTESGLSATNVQDAIDELSNQSGGGVNQAQIGYFVCDTASATAAKTIAATGYALATGGNIRIKMTNANTANAVTLNINGTGAKALFYNGVQASSTNSWFAGDVLEVYYDGAQFQSTLKRESIDYFQNKEEVDLPSQEGYNRNKYVTAQNTLQTAANCESCINIPIDGWTYCKVIGNARNSAYNCIVDKDGNVLAAIQGVNVALNLLLYPSAKYISISSVGGGEFGLYVFKDSNVPLSVAVNEYDDATMIFSKSLRDDISQTFVSKSGGYYQSSGVFVARAGSLYTDLMTVPPKATKAYYTGVSYGSANGGIVWYDKDKRNIGAFAAGSTSLVSDKETSIPSGAVFYKASSYSNVAFNVAFDTPKYNIEQAIKNTDELAEQAKTIKELVCGNFEEYSRAVEIPQAQTETAGYEASGGWGMVLTNTGSINLSTIRFYSKSVKTSFVIGVGSANVEEKTYKIDEAWTIEANISVGENTIDVSSYGIVIPPKALVGCSAPTNYIGSPIAGVSKMVGNISLAKGSKGTYSTNFNYYMQIAYIGIEEGYSVNVPESSLAMALRGNILYGKKYVAIGDSFTAPIGSETIETEPYKGQSKVYPYIIGNRNNMTVLNQGASGSVLNGYIANTRYTAIPQDVDYITIWYGINDSGHGIQIGTVDDQPTTIAAETDTTTCGGFNWMFKWLLTNRPFAHIGVIVTDFTSAERREAIIACCEKWGIAYLDLYNPTVPMIRTRGTTRYTHDTNIAPLGYVEVCSEAKQLRNNVFSTNPSQTNMHPNNDCHEWQSNLIENFMRGL